MRVLIAEHKADLGPLLSDHFTSNGNEVSLVSGVEAAFQLLRFHAFDILILAFDLPENGAIALADYLALRLPDLPVIVTVAPSFVGDSAVFTLVPNARAVMHLPPRLDDLLAMAEHYAARAKGS